MTIVKRLILIMIININCISAMQLSNKDSILNNFKNRIEANYYKADVNDYELIQSDLNKMKPK